MGTASEPLAQGGSSRRQFASELEQMHLQVEVMAVRVDEALERMREVLSTGDPHAAELALCADDIIDEMNVSLTERCYSLLRREAPVASDLRFIVSVIRVLSDLERIGDLVVAGGEARTRAAGPGVEPGHLRHPADDGRPGRRPLPSGPAGMGHRRPRSGHRAGHRPENDGAVPGAADGRAAAGSRDRRRCGSRCGRFTVGQAIDRIIDHSAVIGARLRYMITGDPDHLGGRGALIERPMLRCSQRRPLTWRPWST